MDKEDPPSAAKLGVGHENRVRRRDGMPTGIARHIGGEVSVQLEDDYEVDEEEEAGRLELYLSVAAGVILSCRHVLRFQRLFL